jgi:NAD-dependent dihydropyrimidine dehydrogenase PreA subunit
MIAHIFENRCTGCNDCVSVCPTHVLDPGDGMVPQIARIDQCQTCYMCELYCPADAIYVAPEASGPPILDAAAALAAGHVGRLRHDYGWNREAAEGEGHLRDFWRLGPLLREGAEIAARRYASQHPVDVDDQ